MCKISAQNFCFDFRDQTWTEHWIYISLFFWFHDYWHSVVRLQSTKVCNDMLVGSVLLLRSCGVMCLMHMWSNVQRHVDRIGSPTEIMCLMRMRDVCVSVWCVCVAVGWSRDFVYKLAKIGNAMQSSSCYRCVQTSSDSGLKTFNTT